MTRKRANVNLTCLPGSCNRMFSPIQSGIAQGGLGDAGRDRIGVAGNYLRLAIPGLCI